MEEISRDETRRFTNIIKARPTLSQRERGDTRRRGFAFLSYSKKYPKIHQ
jgi:hypothetical protein